MNSNYSSRANSLVAISDLLLILLEFYSLRSRDSSLISLQGIDFLSCDRTGKMTGTVKYETEKDGKAGGGCDSKDQEPKNWLD